MNLRFQFMVTQHHLSFMCAKWNQNSIPITVNINIDVPAFTPLLCGCISSYFQDLLMKMSFTKIFLAKDPDLFFIFWDFQLLNINKWLNMSLAYLFNRPHRSHKYFVLFWSYVKYQNLELKRKPPLIALYIKDPFQYFSTSTWS